LHHVRRLHLEIVLVLLHVREPALLYHLLKLPIGERLHPKEPGHLAYDGGQVSLQILEVYEQHIAVCPAALPPTPDMVGPGTPPHEFRGAIPLLKSRRGRRHLAHNGRDEVHATGETGNWMPRDVDVAGLGRRGTELSGEMRLDDSGGPLGADERCLVNRNA